MKKSNRARAVRQPSGFEQLPLENAISRPQRREIAGLAEQPTGLSRKPNAAHGKLHYAWIIALAGLLMTGTGAGIFNSSLGVFIKPVCEELGFLRSQFTLYSSISTLTCVALMPFFGALFKRFEFRRLALFGAVTCGLMLVGYSMASKLWHFYVLAFINGLFLNGIGFMAVGILVNKWFADKRGLAAGIAYSGSGIVVAILTPMASKFIELHGWRWTYRFFACVSLTVLVPVILFLVKDKPEDMGLEAYRVTGGSNAGRGSGGDTGLTRSEAFREKSFWFLAAAVMGVTLCQNGPHLHTIPFLSDIGYSTAFVAAVASGYMIFLTGSKVAMGFAFDRLGPLKGSLLIGGCCSLFPVFALMARLPLMPWLYALVLGLASSGGSVLGTFLTACYFGRKDFSRVYSVISMFSYLGVAASSPVLGAIYDVTGSYFTAWILIIVMGLVVCACLIGAYRANRRIVPAR